MGCDYELLVGLERFWSPPQAARDFLAGLYKQGWEASTNFAQLERRSLKLEGNRVPTLAASVARLAQGDDEGFDAAALAYQMG